MTQGPRVTRFRAAEPAYLFGLIFFGIAGYAAYRYGKSRAGQAQVDRDRHDAYPYAISETWLLCRRCGLCVMLYVYRK